MGMMKLIKVRKRTCTVDPKSYQLAYSGYDQHESAERNASLGSTTSIAKGSFKTVVKMANNESSDIMCGDCGN